MIGNVVQRYVRIGIGRAEFFVYRVHDLDKERVSGEIDTKRQCVLKEANERPSLTMPPRWHRKRDRDVILPAVSVNKGDKGSEEHQVQARAVLCAQSDKSVHHAPIESDWDPVTIVCVKWAANEVSGQSELGGVLEGVCPVSTLTSVERCLELLPLPDGKIRILDG